MFNNLKRFISFTGLFLLCSLNSCNCKRNWNYEIKSLSLYSNDMDKLETRATLLGPKSFNIDLNWIYTQTEADTVEITIYRKKDSDWERLPLSKPVISMKEGIKKYYNDLVYTNVGHCGNLPKPSESLNPFPRNSYNLNNCELAGVGFPDMLPSGNYKIDVKFSSSPLQWGIVAEAHITSKKM